MRVSRARLMAEFWIPSSHLEISEPLDLSLMMRIAWKRLVEVVFSMSRRLSQSPLGGAACTEYSSSPLVNSGAAGRYLYSADLSCEILGESRLRAERGTKS